MTRPSYYLTTPIYYVNDVPHVGTAYTTVLADVVARYRRGLGDDVLFLTGTDEHGQKAQAAAERRGLTPQAHCDELQQRFRDAWARLDVSYDDFIRTTEPRHESVVARVLLDLHAKGEIYAAEYEGWYHVSDEVFVTEKDIEERGLDRAKLVRLSERNYFFRMGKYRDAIVRRLEERPSSIVPDHRRNEVLGFLRNDLSDLCISRPKARLSWGIPLPFDDAYVTYVWFDALLNYVSAIGYGSGDGRFERRWPAVHLLGKDILTTHAVYWSAMLLAMGVELPDRLVAHGWWVSSGRKIGKSEGNAIDPLSYADRYGPDALRYFLASEMTVGQDAEFSDERFRARYEAELSNEWGNLLARTLTMIGKFADGRVPTPRSEGGGVTPVRARADEVLSADAIAEKIERFGVQDVTRDAMSVLREANRLVDATQPWKAAKDPAREGDVRDVLYTLAEALRVAAVALSPIVPRKGAQALAALGQPPVTDLRAALRWGGLAPGTPVVAGPVLFPRVEVPA